MEDQRVSPPELLERQVTVVATLGTVVAAVTGQHRDVRRRVSPKFLHAALGRFTQSLREILDHGDVTSLGHRGVPSLGQALAAFEPTTPEASWDHVRAVATAWRTLVAALEERWKRLAWEAAELVVVCEHTDPARARSPQDKATYRGTAWDNLVAAVRWSTVALDWEKEQEEEVASAGATRDAQEAAATSKEEVATSEAMGEAVVARVDTRRGHWAEAALEPLKRLVEACDRAVAFTRNVEFYLWEVKFILKWGEQTSRDVREHLEAKVAEFEQLWNASARLFSNYLLGVLELIDSILLNPYGGPGGPGGPGSRAVAELCEKAIKNILKLLQGQ